MTFLALAHGAQGLLHHGFYFPSTADRSTYYLPTNAPDLWTEMRGTNAMIARLGEALSRGSHRGVTVTDPVHVAAWDLDERLFVLAVNAESHPALTTFEVPGPSPEALYRLGDGSQVARTQSGQFADELPAYEARIYVSVPPAEDEEGGRTAG